MEVKKVEGDPLVQSRAEEIEPLRSTAMETKKSQRSPISPSYSIKKYNRGSQKKYKKPQ